MPPPKYASLRFFFKTREKYLLLKRYIYVIKEHMNVEQDQVLIYLDPANYHVSYLSHIPFGISVSAVRMAAQFYLRLTWIILN